MSSSQIKPFQQYILRTPIFPVSFFRNIMENHCQEAIFLYLENKYVQEAIYLASPELFEALDKWKFNSLKITKKNKQALTLSLLKYLTRMSSRCTPFGLFASCTVGTIKKHTSIILQLEDYSRHTQFDMQFLAALLQDIASKDEIKPYLKYKPNTSVYLLGDFYRYIEYKYRNAKREHSISAIRKSDLLEFVVQQTKSGITFNEIVNLISEDESEREAAKQFLDELIKFQFLVSELDCAILDTNELERILIVLSKIKEYETNYNVLNEIRTQIINLDRKIVPDHYLYMNIQKLISNLGIKYDKKYLFQTDLYGGTSVNTLDENVPKKVLEGLKFLNGIQKKERNLNQASFIKAFTHRYEDREMPLTTVLDTETGIGYIQDHDSDDSHVILDELPFRAQLKDTVNEKWTSLEFILERKLQEVVLNAGNEVYLSEKDFPDFKSEWTDTPATFSVMIECMEEKGKELIFIKSSGGISAAQLIGRFCNGSTDINDLAKSITDKEKFFYSDQILAEIAHIPEARTGNILRRPPLRDFEIPYLSNTVLSEDHQIRIEDLMVSVKNGRIVLRSKKIDKEIIPCLSNAHNYSFKSLPVYHFLCDLQGQGLKPIFNFNWGALEAHYEYFPRLIYKDIILSRAKWKINRLEIDVFYYKTDWDLLEAFTNWRKEKRIPALVNLVHLDNILLLDFEKEIGIKAFLKSIKNQKKTIVLTEFLFTGGSISRNEKEENFCNEIILSYYKEKL